MASISTDPNGNRTIQFIGADAKRRSIRLGKVTAKQANEVKLKVEALSAAKMSGMSLDNDAARWVASIGDDLAKKLAKVGLIPERGTATLDGFIGDYVAKRTDLKWRTLNNLEQTRRHLVGFFGGDRPLREITAADADQWVIHMRGKYAEATAARGIKRARQYFNAARRGRLIAENPFDNIKAGAMDNRDRLFFVTPEMVSGIMNACPDAEWRALIALCRFGGLRCPSEPLQLTWGDIDWDRGRFLVHSPKLEHTRRGGKRIVPLFPELRPHLEELFNLAPAGSVYVITRTREHRGQLAHAVRAHHHPRRPAALAAPVPEFADQPGDRGWPRNSPFMSSHNGSGILRRSQSNTTYR